ncbi:hypothetical protein EDB19DRAFT_1914789 [Suillus lakei]|nr:hypothetical protein EDB19DRAFT_1914789 [Suillus lakei]
MFSQKHQYPFLWQRRKSESQCHHLDLCFTHRKTFVKEVALRFEADRSCSSTVHSLETSTFFLLAVPDAAPSPDSRASYVTRGDPSGGGAAIRADHRVVLKTHSHLTISFTGTPSHRQKPTPPVLPVISLLGLVAGPTQVPPNSATTRNGILWATSDIGPSSESAASSPLEDIRIFSRAPHRWCLCVSNGSQVLFNAARSRFVFC